MGTKEDLVRQQHERELQATEARIRKIVADNRRAIAEAHRQRDVILETFNMEVARVAKILENADWSRAKLKEFARPQRHWWLRPHTDELACLRFIDEPDSYKSAYWMRSDSTLFVGSWDEKLYYPRYSYGMVRATETLRGITSLDDCKFV